MANETSSMPLFIKMILWFMTAVTSLAGYVAYQSKDRIKEQNETIGRMERTISDQNASYKADIGKLTRKVDSLNSVILIRTDNSYEEFKKLIKVDEKQSTITITPKKK